MNPTTIQISRFPDGGYVVHKIRIPGKRNNASAWFTAKGEIIDAEYVTKYGQGIRSGKVLLELQARFRYLRESL
jgi:hypothetical protein